MATKIIFNNKKIPYSQHFDASFNAGLLSCCYFICVSIGVLGEKKLIFFQLQGLKNIANPILI